MYTLMSEGLRPSDCGSPAASGGQTCSRRGQNPGQRPKENLAQGAGVPLRSFLKGLSVKMPRHRMPAAHSRFRLVV